MAPHNQHDNYYDPVGSQSDQPSGHTYQTPSTSSQYPSSAATAGYDSSNYQGYGGNYNSQQYGSTGQQQPTNSSTGSNRVAAATLSNLSGGQEYNQQTTSRSAQQNDNSGWNGSNYPSHSYSGANLHVSNRTQTDASPVYANNNAPASVPSATFSNLSYNNPPEPVQRSSSTYAQQAGTPTYAQQSTTTTAHSYQPSYVTASQPQAHTQPQRYASPLQAVQAQQHQNHSTQPTRPSPQINSRPPPQPARQQSASVEPASTTVDPSQVYDFRAEREKKAKIEAEKRRKFEEAEAARKAEQDRIDEERRQEEQRQREVEEKPKAEDAAKQAEKRKRQAAKAQEIAAEAEAKKRREEEHRMAMARNESNQSETAANALTQMASSGGESSSLPPPANVEEAEMREMFKKMREFNSRNPAMLAKLWEEERQSHAATQSPQPAHNQPRQAPQPAQPASQPAVPASQRPQQEVAPPPAAASAAPQAALKPFKIPSKAASAPKPAPAQTSGSSLWPPGKKGFLAEMAAQWLSARNSDRPVFKQEVLDNLDMNPNYVQLCESLEGLGLKFERAGFARELLRAVPSSATQSTPKPAEASMMTANGTVAQANGTAAPYVPKRRGRPSKADLKHRTEQQWKSLSNGTVDYEMPNFSLATAAQKVNNMHRVQSQDNIGQNNAHQHQSGGPVQPPQDDYLPMQNDTSPPTQPAPHEPPPEIKPASPPRPPADKEEAARKRGFGDLVDLTAEDSDEEPPPKKMMQIAQGQQQRPDPRGQAAQGLGFHYQHQDARMVKKWAMPYGIPQQTPVQQPIPSPAPHILPANGGMRSPSIAPPGQFQPPPQDPQTVPSPQPKRKGPTQEHLQHERIRGKMVVEPVMRDRVARKSTYDIRTIARDVLLATGRHPDMRALNSHLNTMQRLLGERGGMLDQAGNKADLATIRWDIIDPEPAKKAPIDRAPIERSVEMPELDVGDADDEDDMPAPGLLAPTARQQAVDGGDGTMRYVTVMDSNPAPIKMRKKRGRKPKDRQNAPGVVSLAGGAPPIRASAAPQDGGEGRGTLRQSTQRTGTPNAAPANRTAASPAATGAIGYSQFRKLDADGNPIKTKGRPVGWRKSIHSREAQGLTPAKPGTTSGSKLRQSTARKESPLQEPKYQVYKCMWVDCKAELHSLETLKKHVVKFHGHPDSDGLHTCLWQGCQARSVDSSRNGKAKARSAAFSDIEHWINHVDKEHLQPIAWELGDGPRGGLSDHPDTESEAYLSDSHGRSVTPIIRPFEELNTIGEAPGRIMPTAQRGGSSRGREDAERELGKLEERKRATGVVMDKQGVRLANWKRRLGFLDDEDFEDIVESDGDEADGT